MGNRKQTCWTLLNLHLLVHWLNLIQRNDEASNMFAFCIVHIWIYPAYGVSPFPIPRFIKQNKVHICKGQIYQWRHVGVITPSLCNPVSNSRAPHLHLSLNFCILPLQTHTSNQMVCPNLFTWKIVPVECSKFTSFYP